MRLFYIAKPSPSRIRGCVYMFIGGFMDIFDGLVSILSLGLLGSSMSINWCVKYSKYECKRKMK